MRIQTTKDGLLWRVEKSALAKEQRTSVQQLQQSGSTLQSGDCTCDGWLWAPPATAGHPHPRFQDSRIYNPSPTTIVK